MKSVTLLLMEQPHTPQFRGPALKQGHLCPIESRGQLPAFLHTPRLSRSRLCHLCTQQCGLNTGVRKERSVKMKITVKTQTTGYGHPQKKRRGTRKGQDFPASFVFQSQSISKPRLQGIASGTPPPSARVFLHGRNPLYFVNSTLISDTLTSTIPKTAQAGAGAYRTWESRGASQRTPTPRGNPAARAAPLLRGVTPNPMHTGALEKNSLG